jgi:hypothetical protein
MTTVIIQPRTFDEEAEATIELIQLRILIAEADWSGLYDRLEVWRSKSLPEGPYEELTGSGWIPARVPSTASDQPDTPPSIVPEANLNGLDLQVRVDDEDDVLITFSGVDPISFSDAVSQVVSASAGRLSAYLTQTSDFVVEGVHAGTAATLEVTGGEAAPLLGLFLDNPENYGRGKDARLLLIGGKEEYTFLDSLGSREYYYKTRFRNSITGVTSEFSIAFSTSTSPGISASNVITGYVDLVSGDGKPLVNHLVQIFAPTQATLVEGKLITSGQQSSKTNSRGHVEFSMIRGVTYVVSIVGTSIVREIQAPTSSSVKIFSLLEGIGNDEDAFAVQIPNVVYAERRSL